VSAAKLLDRLEGVRKTGPDRWLAKCPAHEDRAPSLSIRELGDGRLLVHDFAGCDVESVLGAVGLEMADLFPSRGPAEHRIRSSRPSVSAADALAAIDHEAQVVAIIAADIAEHRAIDEPTWQRLAQAAQRIGEVRAQANPARVRP
jgi:hypothetical protein